MELLFERASESTSVRLAHNVWAVKYFAISMGAIMALFIIYHWASIFYSRSRLKFTSPIAIRMQRSHRRICRQLLASVAGIQIGRIVLYVAYWAVNLIVALTNVDLGNLIYVAKRFGWISVSNFVLLVFLALRNTPLAPLSANSYEKLRPLHKVAGYTCIFTTCMHAIVYLNAWSQAGILHNMLEKEMIAGVIGGLSMLIIGISTSSYIYKKRYETFYVTHLVLFMLILIAVGLHRPKFSTSTVIIIIFVACLWGLDRLLRFAKVCVNFPGNFVTVDVLPNDAMRVRLTRALRARAGSHAFLWIPALRILESHPFTIVSNNPVEFVIRPYDGFTRDLYHYAQKNPGRRLRCSIDGPYAQPLDFRIYDRVVLVAGGSGASFTFAIATNLVQQMASNSLSCVTKSIVFVWSIRNRETLVWFEEELCQIQKFPQVQLILRVTEDRSEQRWKHNGNEKGVVTPTKLDCERPDSDDLETGTLASATNELRLSAFDLQDGRPDISEVLANVVANSELTDRIAIGVCGPKSLVNSTRKAVSEGRYDGGPSITLFTEEFGW